MNVDINNHFPTDTAMQSYPSFDLLVPVYNEEKIIIKSLEAILNLFDALSIRFPGIMLRVTVVDNGSDDNTLIFTKNVMQTDPRVSYIALAEKGKGRAVRTGFFQSSNEIVGFTDADLAANINVVADMYEELITSNLDIVYGSRYSPASTVERGLYRKMASRIYTKIYQNYLNTNIQDINCGLKLFRRSTVAPVFSQINENGWFFDSELMYLSERKGLLMLPFPVEWFEGKDSKVKVITISINYLKNLVKLKKKYQ